MTDEQLILHVHRGSREAFEALFERYRDAVWRFYRRRVDRPERAEELLQDVFLAVLQGARRYEPRSSFRSYLFGIAFNILQSERRKAAHRPTARLDDDLADASTDPDDALWVRTALASLEPEQREIVMLREYEGLSYQEIADLLHLPLNTVRSKLFRARMDLKSALGGEQDSGSGARDSRRRSVI
jgi:RNA polymerase sigma-70 factor (ECF subfamily)